MKKIWSIILIIILPSICFASDFCHGVDWSDLNVLECEKNIYWICPGPEKIKGEILKADLIKRYHYCEIGTKKDVEVFSGELDHVLGNMDYYFGTSK